MGGRLFQCGSKAQMRTAYRDFSMEIDEDKAEGKQPRVVL